MNLNQAADALAAAIEAERRRTADVVPPGWFTLQQLAKQLGKAVPTVSANIKKLVDAGQWQVKRYRIETGGRIYPTPHYAPKQGKKPSRNS